jgi:hypothetical protein
MFLTDGDLRELTGYVLPSAQKRWLAKNGWEFVVTAFGRPRVLRAYAEQRMGLASAKPTAHTEPDFSHWNKKAA